MNRIILVLANDDLKKTYPNELELKSVRACKPLVELIRISWIRSDHLFDESDTYKIVPLS
jgi:hypothetical protein